MVFNRIWKGISIKSKQWCDHEEVIIADKTEKRATVDQQVGGKAECAGGSNR